MRIHRNWNQVFLLRLLYTTIRPVKLTKLIVKALLGNVIEAAIATGEVICIPKIKKIKKTVSY